MTSSRTPRSTRARWRRSILLTVGAAAAAGIIGPATAGASWSTIDENGNTTPAGQGSAPDSAAGNGGSSSSGGGVVATEVGSTIPNVQGCNWTVKGRLIVRNPTVVGVADGEPLVGVQVKVSGRSAAGAILGDLGYNSWGTDTTDSNGEFSVSETECSDRRVKVEAKFDSDDLRVLGPSSPTWYQLHDTLDEIDPSTIDLNGEPFGGESGEQSTSQARTDAQTWILYRRAIDYVTSIGFPFLNHVTVHNPATLAPNGSWSDPILHDIHIAPQHTNSVFAMLHELGHQWAYPREIGEGCLTSAVLTDGDTHDFQETPCVAFNEGFGDFFGNKLWQEMNAAGLITSTSGSDSTKPLKRAALVAKGLISLSRVEGNELGWDQAFRVLTSPDITRQLFGPGFGATGLVSTYSGPSCANRGVPVGLDDLADALRAVGDSSDQCDLQNSAEPQMPDFFDRAADRLSGFDPLDSVKYVDTVDPSESVEPHEAYGC
jgi:hypothetical protein